ncbi:MAG: restriction endonuclease subunit S, partial [Anaerolineae bacterium]|nr:restriction endonuclease subunit S [Anaerolineae bacterium]
VCRMSARGRLPERWRWVALSDIATIIAGQSPPSETYRTSHEGLPFFQGKADFGSRYPIPRIWCIAPQKIAEPGDILISVRAPVGPTNVADVRCCIGRGLSAIRPYPNIADRDFILYALKISEAALAEQGSGSTFSAIGQNHLRALEIPLPPLPEQRRIVAALEERLATVARARQAARAQLDAARALPAAYLRAVFEGANWGPICLLGDVLIQRREVIHPRNNPRGEALFVGLEHIESGTGNRIGSLPLKMEMLTGRKPKFYKGDIVYGYLRPYLNKVWVAEFEGLCSVDQYVYSVNREVATVEFVSWFMRSPTFLSRAPIDTTPGQLPRIRIEEVAAVELSLPPLDVQQQVMEELSREMSAVKQLVDSLESQLTEIEELPAAYLQQAFNGEL